jgi:hypothetical protein
VKLAHKDCVHAYTGIGSDNYVRVMLENDAGKRCIEWYRFGNEGRTVAPYHE